MSCVVLNHPGTILKLDIRMGTFHLSYTLIHFWPCFSCSQKLEKPLEELPSLYFVNDFTTEDHIRGIRGIRHQWLEDLKVIISIQIFFNFNFEDGLATTPPRMALATLCFTSKMAGAIAIFGEIFFLPCSTNVKIG